MGSSRGSVSAANAAARLEGAARPDGLILISSLLIPANAADSDVLFNLPLERIHGPVLLVHHRQDACPATPFGELARLGQALTNAGPRDVMAYSGGGPPTGTPCATLHHHGFVGQEPEVMEAVAAWMLAHDPRRAAGLRAKRK